MSDARAAIIHCPYCGDEDLHPAEAPESARGEGSLGWECRSCLRVFRVSLLGLAPRPSTVSHETQE